MDEYLEFGEIIIDGHFFFGVIGVNDKNSLTSISIPSMVAYEDGEMYEVQAIEEYAFRDCTSLKTVSIPNSVTNIGGGAFSGCTSLKTVSIPNSVTNIGYGVFDGCTSLQTINLPEGITTLTEGLFFGCTGLEEFTIPDSVTMIEASVFAGCTNLSNIVIPNNVKSIGASLFVACENLQSVSFPSHELEFLDGTLYGMFWGCHNLSTAILPLGIKIIDHDMFRDCRNIENITIPSSVESIDSTAFAGCTKLGLIQIENSKGSIPYISAFPYQLWGLDACTYTGLKCAMISDQNVIHNEHARFCADYMIEIVWDNATDYLTVGGIRQKYQTQWYVKRKNESEWLTIEETPEINNVAISDDILYFKADKAMDGYQFRYSAVGSSDYSNTATLYVQASEEPDAETLPAVEDPEAAYDDWDGGAGEEDGGGDSGDGRGLRIKFDSQHSPFQIRMILGTRSGRIIREMPINHVKFTDDLGNGSEVAFDVYKERCENMYGETDTEFWEKIVSMRLAYCPEFNEWYELSVELTDSADVVKSVVATSLGKSELSQIRVYGIEVNTEQDIAREDYQPTVLYHASNSEISLIDRLLYKAPHYKIGHVDKSIQNIQRVFQFNDVDVYDAMQEVAQEIGCLFRISCSRNGPENINRVIDVYDLWNQCNQCGTRGEFIEACDKCGSTDIQFGYGYDTGIYVDKENLAKEITFTTDIGSVKNCFRLTAGDDLMTATIINCNPNGSQYLWHIPDYMQEDMSEALREKLKDYEALYTFFQREYEVAMSQMISEE